VTSPNEAGYPRSAESSGNGSLPDDPETGSLGNSKGRDVPPWQRGPASRAAQKQSPRTPSRPEPPRGPAPGGHAPGADARLNRFISGGASGQAAPKTAEATPPRNEPVVSEAYGSELPDLSGPPRPAQRKTTPERTEPPMRPASTGRVQVTGRPHAGPVRDGLKSLQLAFRESSAAPDDPGQGPGEKYTGPVW